MGAPIAGVLPVHKREKYFLKPVGMSEGQLQGLGSIMQDRVKGLVPHLIHNQIFEPFLRNKGGTVQLDFQTGIQEGIELDTALQMLCQKGYLTKNLRIWFKNH